MTTPRTFPVKIHFEWLENIGQRFESNKAELIKRDVFFINDRGVIFGKNLFFQTTYNKLQFKREFIKYIKNLFNTKIIFKGNTYILTDIWSTGPYHFYVDLMSKVVELIDFLNFNPRNSRIVLFDDLFTNDVIVPFFRDMGFEGLEIIKLKKNQQYVLVGRNYFVTKPHIMGSNNPSVIPKVYNLIKLNLNQKCQNVPRKKYNGIYYYRTGRNRRVINDDTVIQELTKIGFYCTSFDDLSYMEAFQLMQQTNLFIGIHGGGLANMMFLPPDSMVIEIKNDNPNPNSHCYWHLARSLKFDYTMFVAETVGESNVVEGKGCDVYLDVNKLIELLSSDLVN